MREPTGKSPGEGRSRAAALRACAGGFFGTRAERLHRAGHRAEESRTGPAHLLCAVASAGYRASAIPLDLAAVPLRLSARLPDRNVHPHSADPGRRAVSPLTETLRDEIRRDGPLSFRRFMEAALYDPVHGYYRRARDPFGKQGDFYTAEQIQPVFGILMAARIRALNQEMGAPPDFTVVELGAGRGEMAAAFSEWRYIPVDLGVDLKQGAMPERFRGVVFANEFFDALPVEAVTFSDGAFREMRVAWDERFVWVAGPPAREEVADYLRRYFPPPAEGAIFEVNPEGLAWLERIRRALEAGDVFQIDYGYTRAESVRFPRGTLMSYRRHRADEDVLNDPGAKDITAHVPFTADRKSTRLNSSHL